MGAARLTDCRRGDYRPSHGIVAMTVTKDEFRIALSRFVSGITVVTVLDQDNRPCGITVSAFSSVSLDPPLVLACIDKRASVHDCLSEGSSFAVNILAQDQEHVLDVSLQGSDRLKAQGYREGPWGPAPGAPLPISHAESCTFIL